MGKQSIVDTILKDLKGFAGVKKNSEFFSSANVSHTSPCILEIQQNKKIYHILDEYFNDFLISLTNVCKMILPFSILWRLKKNQRLLSKAEKLKIQSSSGGRCSVRVGTMTWVARSFKGH